MEVLATTESYMSSHLLVVLFLLLSIVSICIIAWSILLMMMEKDVVYLFFAAAGVFMFYSTTSIAWTEAHREPEIEYKVLIHDFNEIYKGGYEIVDQEGEVYTIRKVGE